MKIAFEVRPAIDSKKSGIGYHANGLISFMLRLYPENQYYLEYFRNNVDEKNKQLEEYRRLGNRVEKVECKKISNKFYKLISTIFPIPYKWFFREKPDITHFFNFIIPPFVFGKKVVTIHDMAFRRFPKTVRAKTKLMFRFCLKRTIKEADAIVTVSEFTKQELQDLFLVESSKIYVVPNGVDEKRFNSNINIKDIEKVKLENNITGSYFLFLGTIEPRKNILRLMQSYILAKKSAEIFPSLIIAGGDGWLNEDIIKYKESLPDDSGIKFIGYVPDKDVAALIAGAEVFCFLSLYEGFGIPVIEAMACGTPTLISKAKALTEVAGDAALQVNELSIVDIANGMIELHNNNELRYELSKKGIQQAKMFSWTEATKKLNDLYQKILRS